MNGRGNVVAAVALVVGIAVGSALFWVSFQSISPPDCATPTSGNTPLGTFLTFSEPQESSVGADHWYNFTLQASGGGLVMDNLAFQVWSAGGQPLDPGPEWTLNALAPTGSWLGSYSLTGTTVGTWTSGGGVPLVGGQKFSLLTAPGNVSGGSFMAQLVGSVGSCPDQGTVWTTIP